MYFIIYLKFILIILIFFYLDCDSCFDYANDSILAGTCNCNEGFYIDTVSDPVCANRTACNYCLPCNLSCKTCTGSLITSNFLIYILW